MAEEWVVNSDHTKAEFMKHVERMYDEHKYITFTFKTGKQRSGPQNRALNLYCRQLAASLDDSGYDIQQVLEHAVSRPWSQTSCKELLWRPIQLAMTGNKSTKEPLRGEYIEIYEVLNRHVAQNFGISLPWPSRDTIHSDSA
jgi:hypothetical protein